MWDPLPSPPNNFRTLNQELFEGGPGVVIVLVLELVLVAVLALVLVLVLVLVLILVLVLDNYLKVIIFTFSDLKLGFLPPKLDIKAGPQTISKS